MSMFCSTVTSMKIFGHLPYSVFLKFLLYNITYGVLIVAIPGTYEI